jgi:glutathione S-transferase
MKLLGSMASPYTRKVRIVLAEKRIDFDFELVDVAPPENPVIAVNPLGKVPTPILDDGTALYDSRVIVEFADAVSPLARLITDDYRERAAVRRWEALADGILDAAILMRQEEARPEANRSAPFAAKQRAKVERGLGEAARELGDRSWAHERYSLADIALGAALGWLEFRRPGGIEWRDQYANLARHYDRLMERPAFADSAPR